ncbi:MAG: hypothetical protein HYY17_15080 [Planctomycetes bacterium]|nr:hypothetical protein [Planctomycetota bacterium]
MKTGLLPALVAVCVWPLAAAAQGISADNGARIEVANGAGIEAVSSGLSAAGGTVALTGSGSTLTSGTSTIVDSSGTLSLSGACTLKPGASLSVAGAFSAGGTDPDFPTITWDGVIRYAFTLGGTVAVDGLRVSYTDAAGMKIDTTATVNANRLKNVKFSNAASPGVWLNFRASAAATYRVIDCDFPTGLGAGQYNVRTPAGYLNTVNVRAFTGGSAGETKEDDTEVGTVSPGTIVWAASFTWTGAVNTSWTTAGNWSPSGPPGATDDAVIPDVTNDPVISSAVSCNYLTVQSAAVVTLSSGGALTVNGDLSNSGTFSFAAGTSITFAGTAAQLFTPGSTSYLNLAVSKSADAVTLAGNLTVTNNMTVSAGTVTLGTRTVTVNGTFDATGGSVTFTGAGYLTLGGAVTSLGTFTASTSTVDYASASSQTVQDVIYYNLTVSGGQTATAGFNITPTKLGGTLTISGASILDVNGSFDATGRAVTFGANGTLRLGGAVTSLGGFTAGTGTVIYDDTGANQTVDPTASYYNLTIDKTSRTANVPNGATLTLSNDLTILSGTLSAPSAAAINVGRNWTNNGTFSAGTVVVTLTGTVAAAITGSSNTTFNVLNIGTTLGAGESKTVGIGHSTPASSLTITANVLTIGSTTQTTGSTLVYLGSYGAGNNSVAQTLTVSGSVTINVGTTGGGQLASVGALAHAINVGGTWTNNGWFVAGSSVTTFTTAGTAAITGSANTTFNILNLGTTLGAGTKIVNIGHSTAGSALTITASTLNVGATTGGTTTTVNLGNNGTADNTVAQTLTVTGALTINGTGTNTLAVGSNGSLAHAINVGGNWTKNGAFSPGSGTVTFNGGAQAIQGSTATAFYNVAIAASSTTTLGPSIAANTQVGGSLTVSGILQIGAASGLLGQDLSVTGAFTINTGGTVQHTNAQNQVHTIWINGDLANSGTLDTYAAANRTIWLEFVGSAGTTITGNGTYDLWKVEFGKGTAALTVTNQSTTFWTTGAWTDPLPVRFYAGIYVHDNSSTWAATKNNSDSFAMIEKDAGIRVLQGTVAFSTLGTPSILYLRGKLEIQGGAVTVGDAADERILYDLTTGATPQFTISSGSLTCAGRFSSNAGTDTVTWNQSGGTVTLVTIGSTSATEAGLNIGNTGSSFTMSAGTIVFQRATSNASDVTLLAATSSVTGGTFQFGNASTPNATTFRVNSTVPLPNAVVNGTAAVGTKPKLTPVAALSVKYDLTIQSDCELAWNSYAIAVGGNWTNDGTFTPGATGTVTFNGTTQAIQGAASTVFQNLTIGGTSTTTINPGSGINTDVRGTLSVSGVLVLANSKTLRIGRSIASGTASISGTLRTTSGTGLRPAIAAVDSVNWRHSFTVTGTIDVNGLDFSGADANGLYLNGATITSLQNVIFRDVASGGTHLRVSLAAGNASCRGCFFDTLTGGAKNVTAADSGGASDVFLRFEQHNSKTSASDLSTTAASAIVTSATAAFVTNGVAAGDSLLIVSGQNQGLYRISSVDSATQLTLTTTVANTAGSQYFHVATGPPTGPGAGEANDADNDNTPQDGVADVIPGAVVQWISGAGDALQGTLQGIPTAACDPVTCAYYATYVVTRDAVAGTDRIWALDRLGRVLYSYDVASGYGDIVGTPAWTRIGSDHVVFFGTTGGYLFYLKDTGSALVDFNGSWPFKPAAVDEVTSPVVTDGTNLYFGGLELGTPKLFAYAISDKAQAMARLSTGAIRGRPTVSTISGTKYVFAATDYTGVNAVAWRFDVVTPANDVSNTDSKLYHIRADTLLVAGKLYLADWGGRVHMIAAGGTFAANDWSYYDAIHDPPAASPGPDNGAISAPPFVNVNNGDVFFGDADGHVYRLTSAGGFGWRVSPDGTAITTCPKLVAGSVWVGSFGGTLYRLNMADGAIIERWNLGTTPVYGLDYQSCIGKLFAYAGGRVYSFDVAANSAPLAPTGLTTEGAINPSGVTDGTPDFSATHNDPDGDAAIAYRIQVSTDNTFASVTHWDSERTDIAPLPSGSPKAIVYAGSTLSWYTTYYWRIQFFDSYCPEGAWSATAQFTTATPSAALPNEGSGTDGWNMIVMPTDTPVSAGQLADDMPSWVVYQWNEETRNYEWMPSGGTLLAGRAYFAWNDAAPDTVTVGAGVVSMRQPIDRQYNYTRSQFILLSSQIGTGMVIDKIRFAENSSPGANIDIDNLQVRLRHTSSATIASFDTSGDLVYNGPYTLVVGTGVVEIDITNWSYNGTDNLEIYVYSSDPWVAGYPTWNLTDTGANRHIYAYDDVVDPPTNTTTTTNVPNVTLVSTFGTTTVDLSTGTARKGDFRISTSANAVAGDSNATFPLRFDTYGGPIGPYESAANQFRGWHLVGHPFADTVSWDTGVARVNVDATSYYWDGSIQQYRGWNAATHTAYNGGTANMGPYAGRWILVSSDTNSVTFADPTLSSAPDPLPPPFDANWWLLRIKVDSGGTGDWGNDAGVHPGAADAWDERDARDPGTMANPWVKAYFPHPEWADPRNADYAMDVRKTPFTQGSVVTWTLRVDTNTGAPVTLAWPNLGDLPPNWTFTITDTATAVTMPLTPGGSYTYTAASRDFTIAATRDDTAVGILEINAVPVPHSTLPPGTPGMKMLEFTTKAYLEGIAISQVAIRGSGSGNEMTVASAYLILDADGNGTYDPGDLVAGTGVFAADDGTVTFAVNVTVPLGETKHWYVVYDFGSSAGTFVASLDPADIAATGTLTSLAPSKLGAVVTGGTKTVQAPDEPEGGGCGTVGLEALLLLGILALRRRRR